MAIAVSNMRFGGFWIRLLAVILDGIILGIPLALVSLGLVLVTKVSMIYWVVQLAGIFLVIYLNGAKGGTPGKKILGLRIVNEMGENIGIPVAILRYIGFIISAAILCIGFLMIAFNQKKQGLHDMIAKTYVVYTR